VCSSDLNGGRVLLETHCLQWPAALGAEGGYGKLVRVELLHKLHDELKYDSMDALNQGIQRDCEDARAWLAARI
jgi:riboflavin kinase/FMN adenylyltransferase